MTSVESIAAKQWQKLPSLEHQEQDARKVVPVVVDTMAVHPDAAMGDDKKVSSVESTQRIETVDDYVSKLYDLANWVWGLVFPQSQAPEADHDPKAPQLDKISSNEQLTKEDLERFVSEMRQLIKQIKEGIEEEFHDVNFETLLNEVFKAQIRDKEETAQFEREKLALSFREKQKLNRERLAKLDEMIHSSKTSKLWGIFEKAATGAGIAVAAAGIASGWGIVAFCIGAGLVADQMFDDPAKKKIAGWMGSTQDAEDKWLNGLRLGAGVVTIGLFLGLTGPQAFNATVNIAQGGATLGRGYLNYQDNLYNADVIEINHGVSQKDNDIKRDNAAIKKLVGAVYDYYRNMSEIQENLREAAMALIK